MSNQLMSIEQSQVQSLIDGADDHEKHVLETEAKSLAVDMGNLVANGLAAASQKDTFHVAIEMLVRLEANKYRKGLWFRTKRRLQLTAMYLG